jgi:hypothetical protein
MIQPLLIRKKTDDVISLFQQTKDRIAKSVIEIFRIPVTDKNSNAKIDQNRANSLFYGRLNGIIQY